MAKRKRDVVIKFRVTPEERKLIESKMSQLGTTNMAAYLRKMSIDGYVIKLDIPELREMIAQLRKIGNNINQIAKRVNGIGEFYRSDMELLNGYLEKIWKVANEVLVRLSKIK